MEKEEDLLHGRMLMLVKKEKFSNEENALKKFWVKKQERLVWEGVMMGP